MALASQLPKSSQTTTSPASVSLQPLYLLLTVPRPSTSSSHFRVIYTSGRVALGKIQVGLDLGLPYQRNPRACTPSEQLQTTSELQHPAPAQLILHGGWRLVVSDHSQSLHLTDLSKYLPLTCQQQSSLNYKRRVYSAHMEGTPHVPSLSDRGGCATGPYSTPTTLCHATKKGSHSSST